MTILLLFLAGSLCTFGLVALAVAAYRLVQRRRARKQAERAELELMRRLTEEARWVPIDVVVAEGENAIAFYDGPTMRWRGPALNSWNGGEA